MSGDLQLWIADVETTSAAKDAGVVEIAFIQVDPDLNEVARGHSLIDPQQRISHSAQGIHGISHDMVQDAPTLDEYFQQVLQPPVAGSDVVLICHRVAFDRQFLEPALERAGARVVGQLCTLRLARRYLADAEDHKLATLRCQYGLDGGKSHSADGDVLTCLSLVRFIQSLNRKALMQMIDEENQPVLVDKMPFGKYKGEKISEIPSSYASWCVGPKGMTDMDPDLRATLQLRAEGKI